MIRLIFIFIVFSGAKCDVHFSYDQIALEVGENKSFHMEITNILAADVNKTLNLRAENDIIQIMANNLTLLFDNCTVIELLAHKPGKSGLFATVNSRHLKKKHVETIFLPVKVHRSRILDFLSGTIGWTYFLTWSISFYPQIYSNYRRKSVIGLNFDFMSFNMVGYVMYNIFNVGVYFIPLIKKQYSSRHPTSLNPIRPNDIFFSGHSFFATIVTISQCCIYEKGNQTISRTTKAIIGIYITTVAASIILAMSSIIWWLDVLYLCSYIKLCATMKKYLPQAYMNYKRKSTEGWSICGVTLDFLGGMLSIFQMILDGYNYDDWNIFSENPTKFGLGLLSDGFCLTFLIQHYVLYPKQKRNETELKLVNDNCHFTQQAKLL